MTLQSSSDGGTTWKNVKGKTITMNGFRSEIQEKEATASVPQYDELGNPLTYCWVESNVTENVNGENQATITEWEDATEENKTGTIVKKFTLSCNGGDSETDYFVDKV